MMSNAAIRRRGKDGMREFRGLFLKKGDGMPNLYNLRALWDCDVALFAVLEVHDWEFGEHALRPKQHHKRHSDPLSEICPPRGQSELLV